MADLDQGQVQQGAPVGGQEAPAATPELSIADLTNLRSVIDVAAQRGAFRAAEMEAVGAVFNKLNKFLEAVYPQSLPPSPGVADGVQQPTPAAQ
jgi:hypothetical protein